jgi:hypothetical protein
MFSPAKLRQGDINRGAVETCFVGTDIFVNSAFCGYYIFGKSFTVQGALLWNTLPISIIKSQSLNTFKKLVYEHYLTS